MNSNTFLATDYTDLLTLKLKVVEFVIKNSQIKDMDLLLQITTDIRNAH